MPHSTPSGTGRDPWSGGPRPGPSVPAPASAGRRAPGAEPEAPGRDRIDEEDSTPVPVSGPLSTAIAGFAGLLGVGLVVAAQASGPGGGRIPLAVVVFGVQLLFVLAWTMATRPPAWHAVAGVGVAVAAAADVSVTMARVAGLAPLGYLVVAGFVAAVLSQLFRSADRKRVTESLGATLLIVVGVVAFATLIVLNRIPVGTQAMFVCLAASAVALVIARLTDAVLPRPRLAPQVPRGATGIVIGAMCGTLASGVLGSYLTGFTPTSGAVVGLVVACVAVLADLAVGYAEAGRQMAGEPPTMWIARHMQGPLGGFALAAPAAYAVTVLFF